MAINVMLNLVVMALTGFIRLRMRYDRILSWLMFFATAFLFADYCNSALLNEKIGFAFLWSKTKIGDITVSFFPSVADNHLIIPIFLTSLFAILNNNIFRYEEKRSQFNAILILNFVTLSLLICAENYVQLITAVFVSDILGYLILKDVDSSRRYVIYNFFADMCLFMILALACGKIQSLELSSLLNYKQIGRHRDFVGIVTAVAVFIKVGCFLFQSYLQDIAATRFQRMSAVNLLFSPLVGFLLLVKLHNLLLVSNLFIPLLSIMSVATFLSGLVYFIVKDNIQKKMVCLNMAFYGMLMYILRTNDFKWTVLFSYYLVVVYFFNLLFFKIYLYQNREERVSKMLNGRETNALPLQTLFMEMVFLSAIFLNMMIKIVKGLATENIAAMTAGILLGICVVLNHIYKSPYSRRLDYLNPNPERILSFIVNAVLLVIGGYLFNIYNWRSVLFFMCFLGIAALPVWKKLRSLYEKEWLQKEDVSKSLFFYTLVEPLKYISRVLWLIVDFMLTEKVITAVFSAINKWIVAFFFKINQKSIPAGIWFIIMGLAVFVLSFYRRYFQ